MGAGPGEGAGAIGSAAEGSTREVYLDLCTSRALHGEHGISSGAGTVALQFRNRLMLEVIDMTELVEHVVRCYCPPTEASAVAGVTTRNDRSRGSTEPIRM